MEVLEGQILAGKYRVERVLGRGGMGLVVAATHLQLGERVALKFLLPEAMGNPDAVARFVREARAAVRIKSEHVARVSDVGTLDSGAPYIVMEYLEGLDLAQWLVQRGPLQVEQAVEFVLQASEAIAEAHTLGIVHRDLKPANLFIIERPDGALVAKVLDFGISKAMELGNSGPGMTKTSASMGSPLYMSPEQLESAKDVDTRGDIWSLGVVLYELVSGQPPFPGETMPELVLRVISAPPTPLKQAPPGFEAALFKCLEKSRAARYQTVAELAVALLEFAPHRSLASVERIGRVMERAGMSASVTSLRQASLRGAAQPEQIARSTPGTNSSWAQTYPPSKRRRRVLLLVASLVAVSIVGVGVLALSRGSRQLAAPAPSSLLVAADPVAAHSADGSQVGSAVQPNQALPSGAAAVVVSAAPHVSGPGAHVAPPGGAVNRGPVSAHTSAVPKSVVASPVRVPVGVLPPPAPVVAKPAKNPLTMPIQ